MTLIPVSYTHLYEETRKKIKNFINAKEPSEIVFTDGTTNGMNIIVSGFFKDYLKKDDEVLITLSEHASNIIQMCIRDRYRCILTKDRVFNGNGKYYKY